MIPGCSRRARSEGGTLGRRLNSFFSEASRHLRLVPCLHPPHYAPYLRFLPSSTQTSLFDKALMISHHPVFSFLKLALKKRRKTISASVVPVVFVYNVVDLISFQRKGNITFTFFMSVFCQTSATPGCQDNNRCVCVVCADMYCRRETVNRQQAGGDEMKQNQGITRAEPGQNQDRTREDPGQK